MNWFKKNVTSLVKLYALNHDFRMLLGNKVHCLEAYVQDIE